MNAGRQLLRVGAAAIPKQGTRSYVRLERIRELQKLYQSADGLPVHLKNGKLDLTLYRIAYLSCAGFTLFSLNCLYKLAFRRYG